MIDRYLSDFDGSDLTVLTPNNSLRSDTSVFCSLTAVDKSAFFTNSTFIFIPNKVGETD